MDRSLDEIIAERPTSTTRRQNRSNRPRRNNSNFPRDGVKKSSRADRADLNLDWVHDKFEDDRDTRPNYRTSSRQTRGDRYSPEPNPVQNGAKLRINNLHYDLTEADLEDLFSRIGPILTVSLRYDRAGRSQGIAFVIYKRLVDAQTAIREFDGANAKGQPIRITLVSAGPPEPKPRRNPFDFAERPKGSLFDRTERPRSRDTRSLSPGGGSGSENGGPQGRRSDVSKPPPDNIDRYIPGQRSPRRRNDGGRNRGRRPGERNGTASAGGGGRRAGNTRPKKTQEQLDQEMEDYWGTPANTATGTAETAAPAEAALVAPADKAADDDIDMIE